MNALLRSASLLTLSLLSAPSAWAECVISHQADTPSFNMNAQNSRSVILYLSNVSDNPITVSVSLYNSDGSIFTNSTADSVYALSGFPTQAGGIVMPARSTGYMLMYGNGNHRIGHANIRWDASTCLTQPMTAMIEHQQRNAGSGDYSITTMAVNGGLPF